MYRSVCTNISNNIAPVMSNVYDDFWSKGARRVQIYYYSISSPYCKVVTVKPMWRDECVADHGGNATLCHKYVLDNFEMLRKNRLIHMGVNNDFGGVGVPFLRCKARPLVPFDLQADLLAHQTYWAGGTYHVSIQTSECRGIPLVRSDDLEYTLFQSINVDQGAENVQAMPPDGWFAYIISRVYSIVCLSMIVRGIVLAMVHTRMVRYLPNGVRYSKECAWIKYAVPLMPAAIFLTDGERTVITMRGSLLIASDIWMKHWPYMYMSILDTLANLRLTYVTLQVASWYLNIKMTLVGFLFLCGAVTKMTWITCFLQTVLRVFMKLGVRGLRAIRLVRSSTRAKVEWYIDSASMFLSFKLYNVFLCILLYCLMKTVYGGVPTIASFWNSDIVVDLTTLLVSSCWPAKRLAHCCYSQSIAW